MLLKTYFHTFKHSAFELLLLDFEFSFISEELNRPYREIQAAKDFSIIGKINTILKNSEKSSKNFIVSSLKEEQYSNCRALDKVSNAIKLIEKLKDIEPSKIGEIKEATNDLLVSIHANGNIYYAIAKSFEGSGLEYLPIEVIGNIFDYIQGDINL